MWPCAGAQGFWGDVYQTVPLLAAPGYLLNFGIEALRDTDGGRRVLWLGGGTGSKCGAHGSAGLLHRWEPVEFGRRCELRGAGHVGHR